MNRVDNIILVRECGLHHLSVGDRDIWLADDEIKALECILKDYNADTNTDITYTLATPTSGSIPWIWWNCTRNSDTLSYKQ